MAHANPFHWDKTAADLKDNEGMHRWRSLCCMLYIGHLGGQSPGIGVPRTPCPWLLHSIQGLPSVYRFHRRNTRQPHVSIRVVCEERLMESYCRSPRLLMWIGHEAAQSPWLLSDERKLPPSPGAACGPDIALLLGLMNFSSDPGNCSFSLASPSSSR